MITVTLYVYANNTDLHCVSAFETIRHVLNESVVTGLHRYRKLSLTFDVNTKQEAMDALTRLTEGSYDLLNPNKESYYLDSIPCVRQKQSCLVEVCSINDADNQRLCNRITSKHPTVSLVSVKESVVWEMILVAEATSDEITECYDRLVMTTSRTQGLLMNPLFETQVRLLPDDVYAKAA